LGGFGGGIGFFEVADDHDVLVVEGVGWCGVVEAAGDDEPVVDDHQLVVDLGAPPRFRIGDPIRSLAEWGLMDAGETSEIQS
jgi:hypothetical protein